MGTAYLLVHLKYTVPPAVLLTYLYKPLWTRLDSLKLGLIVLVSVLAITPWDSYMIRHGIWEYPPDALLGPTLFDIPVEELFFFVIQTYDTTLGYLLLTKHILHVAYLNEVNRRKEAVRRHQRIGIGIAIVMVVTIYLAWNLVLRGKEVMYLGLLMIWAVPFLLLLWCYAYRHLLSLPWEYVALPIALPTAYFWVVDTLELLNGTWVINEGVKLGVKLCGLLELEEALFYLITNTLIIFGLSLMDYGLALYYAFPSTYPVAPPWAALGYGVMATLRRDFPEDEYVGIVEAVRLLGERGFYTASAAFEGRLRLDIISLYGFCRAADDLIDEATSPESAERSFTLLDRFLDIAYESAAPPHPRRNPELQDFVQENFPQWVRSPLLSLPVSRLPREPLNGLLAGFRIDLRFSESTKGKRETSDDASWPIQAAADLEFYSHCVAGTVGEMITTLVLHYYSQRGVIVPPDSSHILKQANRMGIALQYVNIARDIVKDAGTGRVYLPAEWIHPLEVLDDPLEATKKLRYRLLDMADAIYAEAGAAIEMLPREARAGIRAAVEVYMDIGRELRTERPKVDGGWKREVSKAWRVWNLLQA